MRKLLHLILILSACQKYPIQHSPILLAKYVENEEFNSYWGNTDLQVLSSQQAMDSFFKPSFFEQLTFIGYENKQVVEYTGNRYCFDGQGFAFNFQKKLGADSLLYSIAHLEPEICQPMVLPPPKSVVLKDTVVLPARVLNLDTLHITFYNCHELLNVWWEEKIGVLAYKGKDWALLLDKIYILGEKNDSICLQPLHFAFAKQQRLKYK